MRYVELVEALAERGIRFVIVGGVAVVLHGVPRTTFDLDILLDLAAENVIAFVDVMAEQGLLPRAPVDPRGLADPTTRSAWIGEKHLKAFSFSDPRGGVVDVLLVAPLDYAEAVLDAEEIRVRAATVWIASIPALIRLKRAAGRDKDKADIEALEVVQQLAGEEEKG